MSSFFLVFCSLLMGCGAPSQRQAEAPAAPVASEGAECAVCGMVVDEEPGPRAQVLRADGTREFFCSMADLRAALASPSPHGAARQTWVEPVEELSPHGAPGHWESAERLSYVVGFENPGVMGRPALAVLDPATAQRLAEAKGGWIVSWSSLLATPFNVDPPRSP